MKYLKRFNESDTSSQWSLQEDEVRNIFQELLDENFVITIFDKYYLNHDLTKYSETPKAEYFPGYFIRIDNNNINQNGSFSSNYSLKNYISHLEIFDSCLERIDGVCQIQKLKADTIQIFIKCNDTKELSKDDHDYIMVDFVEVLKSVYHNITERMSISSDRMKKNTKIDGRTITIDLSNVASGANGEPKKPTPTQKNTLLRNFKKYYDPNFSHNTYNSGISYDLNFSLSGDVLTIKYLGKLIYINHKKYDLTDEAPVTVRGPWTDNTTYEDIEMYIKH